MAFDGFVLRHIVEELRSYVHHTIEGAYLLGPNDVRIHVPRARDLLLSCTPNVGRITASKAASKAKGRPWYPGRLVEATCVSVQQVDQDRILALEFSRPDRLGGETHSRLLLELTGRNSNLILVDHDTGLILDALRKVTPKMSQQRQILPGRPYLPPPRQDRVHPDECGLEGFENRLASAGGLNIASALIGTLPLASPSVARFIAHEAGVSLDALCADLDRGAVRRLHEASVYLYALDLSGLAPCVLLNETGRSDDFCAVPPVWLPKDRVVPCRSMMDAVGRFFDDHLAHLRTTSLRRGLSRALERKMTAALKRVENMERHSTKADRAPICKIKGDLLVANLDRVSKGQLVVELDNFYDPAGSKITIELDPRLSPSANAQRYFKQYRKAKAGRASIAQQLQLAQQNVARAEAYQSRLKDSHTLDALEQLSEELVRDQVVSLPQTRIQKARKKGEKGIAPRRYVTSDGWAVLVGRTDAENDILTHRIAAGSDLWFHARGCAGSHVILRREGKKGQPGKTAVGQAAALAAYWSKARHSATVPVDYTQVKYVSKPRASKPGVAAIRFEKTVFVEPGLISEADEQEREDGGTAGAQT